MSVRKEAVGIMRLAAGRTRKVALAKKSNLDRNEVERTDTKFFYIDLTGFTNC